MRVVVDANVVAAALVRPDGRTAERLRASDLVRIVPETLIAELADNEVELAARADVSLRVWRKRVAGFLDGVEVVPMAKLRRLHRNVLVLVAAQADLKDAHYAAAFVASGADFLWTRDRALLDALPGVAVLVVP